MNLTARTFILSITILLFTSCESSELNIAPKDLIPEDTMVLMLTDIHLVEGAKVGRKIMGDTVLMDVYYRKIFDKYQIDKVKFEESFRFYSNDPKKMDGLYASVIDNLNQLQKNAPDWRKQDELKKSLNDSTNKITRADSLSLDSIKRRGIQKKIPLRERTKS